MSAFVLVDERTGDEYELQADSHDAAIEEALQRRDWWVKPVERCSICGRTDEDCPGHNQSEVSQ